MMRTLLAIFVFFSNESLALQCCHVSPTVSGRRSRALSTFQRTRQSGLFSSTLGGDDDFEERQDDPEVFSNAAANEDSLLQKAMNEVPFLQLFKRNEDKKLPPMQVEDSNLLFYDVFLIVNLTLSISFWVTHRLNLEYMPTALSEGCLFSLLWIGSGLYHGSFLMSAVDGHYGSTDDRGGPKAAVALALNTFVSAVNLRLIFAFAVAVIHHREVGVGAGEELLPLEIGFGLLLMGGWRWLHSYITPRM